MALNGIKLVDVGFNLIVEVTRSTSIRLGLEEGLSVYCLFKSVASKVQ